ncbi:hypothetical protein GCM10011391_19240 [Pullulanibacillus camelliae]|uniref:DUF3794 domain-containing protein n=1 Tax=Pullulanibacillus camelliae TaxID=1707096 RepID=A0A8J2VUY1_9BACL|nr:DUF3794 domain-containing protein [Pullulanibacillus camelliae]GGE40607.1 hypothetical protein GCM10011391_19240 [Pullulanibacillus camelliae]
MSEEHKQQHEHEHAKPSSPHLFPKPPKTSVQPIAKNTPLSPQVSSGASIAKVPVVLAETTVQIDLDSTIKLPEPALEIKRVKKNLKLVQCRLLLPTNKLFIKGFVRKNIQYAAPRYGSHHGVQSVIKSYTVDIPFNLVTEVNFIRQPEFKALPESKEFSFFSSQPLPAGFAQKDSLLSGDFSEFNQISGEVFNELPYCELLSSKFIEYDEFLDRKMGDVFSNDYKIVAPFEEGTFTKIEEKMVVELSLKVLQNQQIKVGEQNECPSDTKFSADE